MPNRRSNTSPKRYADETPDARGNGAPKASPYTWRHQLLRLPWLVLILVGLLIPFFLRNNPDSVERVYSRSIYPVIASVLGKISSLVSFSIAEIAIISIVLILVVVLLVRLIRLIFGKLIRRRQNRIRFFSYLISLCIFFGIMLNLFYCLWGFNHYRTPIDKLLDMNVEEYTVTEIADAYERLSKQAALLREQVNENGNNVFALEDTKAAYLSVVDAYSALGKENPIFDINVFPVKPVGFSKFLSRIGISGIYIPYTAEANINVDQPDLYILADAAHETAHFLGFAREDEATFIAYLASQYSDNPAFKYSCTMQALASVGNRLYYQDEELYIEITQRCYSNGMKLDREDYIRHLEKYRDDPLSKLNDKINDAYLKHNGQQAGVQSYSNSAELIIAYLNLNNK